MIENSITEEETLDIKNSEVGRLWGRGMSVFWAASLIENLSNPNCCEQILAPSVPAALYFLHRDSELIRKLMRYSTYDLGDYGIWRKHIREVDVVFEEISCIELCAESTIGLIELTSVIKKTIYKPSL